MWSRFVPVSPVVNGSADPLGNIAAGVFVFAVIVQDYLANTGSLRLRSQGRALNTLGIPMLLCVVGILLIKAVGE